MSTLYKILGALFPPPTSMLLFLIKSLGKKNSFAANNIDIGGRGIEWHIFATYFVHDCSLITFLLFYSACHESLANQQLIRAIFQKYSTKNRQRS